MAPPERETLMKPLLAVACAGVLAFACAVPAFAAYGAWEFIIPGETARCPALNVHVDATGGELLGTVGTAKLTFHVRVKIAPDGSFDWKSPTGSGAHFYGKVAGDTITATYTNSVCPDPRSGTGKH